jgi:adenylosuccinate lyase
VDLGQELDPQRFVGRAPEQVDAFVRDCVEPIRKQYREVLERPVEGEVRV